MQLQKFLNAHHAQIATTGVGAPGNEGTYFGTKTLRALTAYQKANHITPASGYFGPKTMKFVNNLLLEGK